MQEVSSIKVDITTDEAFKHIEEIQGAVVLASKVLHAAHGVGLGPMVEQVREQVAAARSNLETHKQQSAATEFMGTGSPEALLKVWNEAETFHPSIMDTLAETADFCLSSLCDMAKRRIDEGELDREQWHTLQRLATEINEASKPVAKRIPHWENVLVVGCFLPQFPCNLALGRERFKVRAESCYQRPCVPISGRRKL